MHGGYINWGFDLKLLKNILKALQKWVSISLQSLKIDLFYQNILSETPKLWLINYSILTKASPNTSFLMYQPIGCLAGPATSTWHLLRVWAGVHSKSTAGCYTFDAIQSNISRLILRLT